MRAIIAIAVAVLAGCGLQLDITYHFNTSREDMAALSGDPAIGGYATWRDNPFKRECDVYLLPFDLYQTDTCYQAVLAHEQQHCREGAFHEGPYYIMECQKQGG